MLDFRGNQPGHARTKERQPDMLEIIIGLIFLLGILFVALAAPKRSDKAREDEDPKKKK